MSHNSIARKNYVNQPMEGNDLMNTAVINLFVHDLINQHAVYRNGSLSLYVSELPKIDQRLFLSHVTDADEFEWFCETESRLFAGIEEYKDYMQSLINEQLDDCWHESMRDAGLTQCRHSDNGEVYYYKK